jgi:excisionase family DNA binding protein
MSSISQPRTAASIPSRRDIELAGTAQRALKSATSPEAPLRLRIASPGRKSAALDLPPVVTRLLSDILRETAAGNALTLMRAEPEVTTQQAADLLNVSRPFLVGLVESGKLPARKVGKHRRLPLRDVLAYKAETFAKRSAALDELAAYDQELGLE